MLFRLVLKSDFSFLLIFFTIISNFSFLLSFRLSEAHGEISNQFNPCEIYPLHSLSLIPVEMTPNGCPQGLRNAMLRIPWSPKTKTPTRGVLCFLEATLGIEPRNGSFADSCLTAWLCRHIFSVKIHRNALFL